MVSDLNRFSTFQLYDFEALHSDPARRHSTASDYTRFSTRTGITTSSIQTISTTPSITPLGRLAPAPTTAPRYSPLSNDRQRSSDVTKRRRRASYFAGIAARGEGSSVVGFRGLREHGVAPSRGGPAYRRYEQGDRGTLKAFVRIPDGLSATAGGNRNGRLEEEVGATVYPVSNEQRERMNDAFDGHGSLSPVQRMSTKRDDGDKDDNEHEGRMKRVMKSMHAPMEWWIQSTKFETVKNPKMRGTRREAWNALTHDEPEWEDPIKKALRGLGVRT